MYDYKLELKKEITDLLHTVNDSIKTIKLNMRLTRSDRNCPENLEAYEFIRGYMDYERLYILEDPDVEKRLHNVEEKLDDKLKEKYIDGFMTASIFHKSSDALSGLNGINALKIEKIDSDIIEK